MRVITKMDDPLILNTLNEDTAKTHEEALLHIYSRLRPGNPPSLERAKELFHERFFDAGALPPRFGRPVPPEPQVRPERLRWTS